MPALIKMPVAPPSKKVTIDLLISALLKDSGAIVSSMPDYDESDGNKAYSQDIEWFDPLLVSSMEEYQQLPWYWQSLLRNITAHCLSFKYRFIHCPTEILCYYPQVCLKGIFIVTNPEATPDTVVGEDLIHSGGEFIEFNNDDKKIWTSIIEENAARLKLGALTQD